MVADAIVIGAGAAGLAAARDLSHAGMKVTVLEARERLGGRIHTIHDRNSPMPIELGAEFVHGEAEETFAIIRAAGLVVDELPDDHYYLRGGQFSAVDDFWERLIKIRKHLVRYIAKTRRKDFPISEFLERGRLKPDDRRLFQDFVEGYHAAYPGRVSARWIAGDPDEEGDDNKQFRLQGGNDALIHWLRGGLDPRCVEVRLNTVVTRLEWCADGVTASCRNGLGAAVGPFRGKTALLALPHAVLAAGSVRFDPPLEEKERALNHLAAGQVFKIVFRFRERFWDEPAFLKERVRGNGTSPTEINFLHTHEGLLPTWWTARPAQVPLITGWAGGPRAEALLNESAQTQIEQSLDSLAEILRVKRARLDDQLEACSCHNWQADPFSRGAYTYVSVGGSAAQADLAKPVKGTLFFAGEATDPEQTGTVAGAIASGRRAAKQLLHTRKG